MRDHLDEVRLAAHDLVEILVGGAGDLIDHAGVLEALHASGLLGDVADGERRPGAGRGHMPG
jgi:hypothetical protein